MSEGPLNIYESINYNIVEERNMFRLVMIIKEHKTVSIWDHLTTEKDVFLVVFPAQKLRKVQQQTIYFLTINNRVNNFVLIVAAPVASGGPHTQQLKAH